MVEAEGKSLHFIKKVAQRDKFIREKIGVGNVIKEFVVDRGHKDGEEIHSLTDTGVIVIKNKEQGKVITEIIARPEQIRKLYKASGEHPPRYVLRRAYWNNANGYNER